MRKMTNKNLAKFHRMLIAQVPEKGSVSYETSEYATGMHEIYQWLGIFPIVMNTSTSTWLDWPVVGDPEGEKLLSWENASEKINWDDPLIALAMEAGE